MERVPRPRLLQAAIQPIDRTAAKRPDWARQTHSPADSATSPVSRQENLLELFPKGVWQITLPAGKRSHGALVFLVIAFGTPTFGQARSEITTNG